MPPEPGALAGAAEAVTALYEAHALGLIRLAVVMLGDRPAAEDVVQEAFCGLYRRWHALSDTANALAYVRSSVINGCRSALRRRVKQLSLAPALAARISVGALSVEVLWSNASGSVLIGVIPDGGGGRVGVISGNEFTPLPLSGAASTPMQSGTW